MTTFKNVTTGTEHAIVGVAENGIGTHGTSATSTGAGGVSGSGIGVHGVSTAGPGVRGDAADGVGVFGSSKSSTGTGGNSESGIGVHGISKTAQGVVGVSTSGVGVMATSTTGEALHAETDSAGAAAIVGINTNTGPGGPGLSGFSEKFDGVAGVAKAQGKAGVAGNGNDGMGILGSSDRGEGVHGESKSANVAAIAAVLDNAKGTGAALYAEHRGLGAAVHALVVNPAGVGAAVHAETRGNGVGIFAKGGRLAALFEGNVEVTGDITFPNAADCAEEFDVYHSDPADPGSVMVFDEAGLLRQCEAGYDKRVAGVVSGAGKYRPGLVLDQRPSGRDRLPIALLGKVFCKIDAREVPIEVGDILTTSPTPGHAMKATDQTQTSGAVIGKSLRAISGQQGLVPILVALQ